MQSLSRALLVPALVLALSACSGGGGSTAALEDNLAAQEQALEALRERVDEVADSVQAVQSTDPMSALSDVSDRLDELANRLEAVEQDVTDQQQADDTARTNADRLAELATEIESVQGSLDGLASTLSDLTDRVEQLEQQFADHRQGHPTEG